MKKDDNKSCPIFNEYDKVQNFDDVFYRSVIIGVLSELMDGIRYNQVVGGKIQQHQLPVYYSMTGDETWLKDNFLDQYQDCFCPDKSSLVEGNIDKIPRGIIQLESISLDAGQLTSNTTIGTYTKRVEMDEGYRYETFASRIRLLPQVFSFTLRIRYDTVIQGWRLVQSIYREYYKSRKFNIQFEGFTIPCNMGLQEDIQKEAKFEFEYPNSEDLELTCNFEVESYLPVIDPTEERHASNRLQNGVEVRLDVENTKTEVRPDYVNPTKGEILDPLNVQMNRDGNDHEQTKGDLHNPSGYDIDGNEIRKRPSVKFKSRRNR